MRSGVEMMTLFGLYDITVIIKVAGVRSCNMRYEIVKQVYFLILGFSRFTVYEFAPVIKGKQLLSEPGVL
jgi:hypothetical protein